MNKIEMKKAFYPVDNDEVVGALECTENLLQLLIDWFEEYNRSKKTELDKATFLERTESYQILALQVYDSLDDLRERAKLTDEAELQKDKDGSELTVAYKL